eukprot:2522458-Amphidinium_carterae.1
MSRRTLKYWSTERSEPRVRKERTDVLPQMGTYSACGLSSALKLRFVIIRAGSELTKKYDDSNDS